MIYYLKTMDCLVKVSPTPGATDPVWNWAAQHEVSGWRVSERAKLHLPLPTACITTWTHPLTLSVEKLPSTKLVPGAKTFADRWFSRS